MEKRKEKMTLSIFSVRLDAFASRQAARARLKEFLDDANGTNAVFTPNPEIVLRAQNDKAYAETLNRADLLLPDGFGLVLVSALKYRKRLRRFSGVDTAEMLLEMAAKRKARVLFLGGRNASAIRAAEQMMKRYPSVRIFAAGDNMDITEEGTAASPEHERAVADVIRQAQPKIILVGLGAPKQEEWIIKHLDQFPEVRIMMTVGGSFDFWSGRLRRAPKLLRVTGLEWLWRLVQEPKRFRRIFRATVVFPWYALTE